MINKKLKIYPENAKPYVIELSGETEKKTPLLYDIAIKNDGLSKIPESEGEFHRKVIISTNVNESSLTFGDPILHVIDGGLEFNNYYDAENYCFKLGKMFVLKPNIKQRCGRTGRTNAGDCHHIYSEKQYDKEFSDYPAPSILTEDITKDLLGLICLKHIGSVSKLHKFLSTMIEPFDHYKKQVERGLENLSEHNMINQQGDLTIIGNICSQFGKIDHKINKMILGGYYLGCMPECITSWSNTN